MYEFEATIPTLWQHVRSMFFMFFVQADLIMWLLEFQEEHPEFIAKDNALSFMSTTGENYNLCHCTLW